MNKTANHQRLLEVAQKHGFDVFVHGGLNGPDSSFALLGDHDSVETVKSYIDQLEEFHAETPDRFIRIPRCDRSFPPNDNGAVLWAWLDTECAECKFTYPGQDPNQEDQ